LKDYDEALQGLNPKFRRFLESIPKEGFQRLPPDWLHLQILERFAVLEYANIVEGSSILEICCGPHAIATIPLAALVGENGRVVAVELGRWGNFWKILNQSGLSSRVIPLQEDATKLPFPFSCFDLVTCVHGIRSFDSRESVVKAFREMLRVTKERIFIAESSPIAKNKAQEAHLSMYNLRHPTFSALDRGHLGDLHYFTPEEMRNIIMEAGASKVELRLVDVDMPHHLAYFPLEEIEKIGDKTIREDLEERWRHALEMLDKYGEEHPPVTVTTCWK
jgi:ubiquinone/menaquinone biosynthesis C-methylase UbiE